MFPDAVIYDPFSTEQAIADHSNKEQVNSCDIAIVAVPTNPAADGSLDMSIIEEVISWIETPLILIKSALMPGTVDRLVRTTGKNIAVSVEVIGESNYFVPYWRHPHVDDPRFHGFLIVGGEEETARRCADILWSKMSPDIDIHLVSAVEAEICKLMENTWGALKVTFANVMYDICEAWGANYTKALEAWGADGRADKMYMRVIPGKRGWNSKCYNKDIPAFANAALSSGALASARFLASIMETNNYHLEQNNT